MYEIKIHEIVIKKSLLIDDKCRKKRRNENRNYCVIWVGKNQNQRDLCDGYLEHNIKAETIY